MKKQEINQKLAINVTEPTPKEWASQIVFRATTDRTFCFCVNQRMVNEETFCDSHRIPCMNECIDSLGDVTVFSALDANSSYWQVETAKEDRDKTGFAFHHGVFCFTHKPFGLKNAPDTIQRGMEVLLTTVRSQFAFVYLNFIVLYAGRAYQPSWKRNEVIIRRWSDIEPEKCQFFTNCIDY